MTKFQAKILGVKHDIHQLPAHFIAKALDDFLISSDITNLIQALVNLGIGLEIYIKTLLEEKEPALLTHLDWTRWNNIKKQFKPSQLKKEQRKIISTEIYKLTPLKNTDKTLDYGLALEIFSYYFAVPKKILEDLQELRIYRNGLFHWKAPEKTSHYLTKQCIRIFDWLFTFMVRKIGWWIGKELNIIDPMGEKRKYLKDLRKIINNENLLNVERRVFQYHKRYETYVQVQTNYLYGDSSKEWQTKCPACSNRKIILYESSSHYHGRWKKNRISGVCSRCDFHFSDIEYEAYRKQGTPTLKQIFKSLPQ